MSTTLEKRFPATDDALPDILGWVEETSSQFLPFEKALNMQLAVEEAIVNVVSYAYKDTNDEPFVTIKFIDDETALTLVIDDSGKCFNQLELTAYDYNADVETRQIGGLGRPFILTFTDKQGYEYIKGHNILTLVINK